MPSCPEAYFTQAAHLHPWFRGAGSNFSVRMVPQAFPRLEQLNGDFSTYARDGVSLFLHPAAATRLGYVALCPRLLQDLARTPRLEARGCLGTAESCTLTWACLLLDPR